jgi:dienelactone hydrolase
MQSMEPKLPDRVGMAWRLALGAALLAVVPLACAQDSKAQATPALEGRWVAEARMGEETMALTLDVGAQGGSRVARISVPAERVLGLRLEEFVVQDRDMSFRIPHADHPMDFAGRIEGPAIDGTLAMAGRELPITFQRVGSIPPPPYTEIEVSFPGAQRTVGGSLFLPPGEGSHAGLALFHATSNSDRDYLRYYADLAARAGVATLIYDRRPVPIDLARLSRTDFLAVVADAEAAVRFLRERPDMDAARVGVGGLSQGAWIAALVASRVPEVAFVIGLSPPGVPLHEIDLYQSNARLEQAGVRGATLAEANQLLADLHAASRDEFADREALGERLQLARTQPWASILDLPERVPAAGTSDPLLRWSAGDLDPVRFFGDVRVPVLLAFGGRDERLPSSRCVEGLRGALALAGNDDVTVLTYPDANHALLPAPELESRLTAWLRARAE